MPVEIIRIEEIKSRPEFIALHPAIQDMAHALNQKCLSCTKRQCVHTSPSTERRSVVVPSSFCETDSGKMAQYHFATPFINRMADRSYGCERIRGEVGKDVISAALSTPREERHRLMREIGELQTLEYRKLAEEMIDEGQKAHQVLGSNIFTNIGISLLCAIDMVLQAPQPRTMQRS